MLPKEFEVDGKKFTVELQEVMPSFYFPERKATLPALIVSGWLEGIPQPISVYVPTSEATLDKVKEAIRKRRDEILKAIGEIGKAK